MSFVARTSGEAAEAHPAQTGLSRAQIRELGRADLAACRDMLRGGSRTFFAAARVLPRWVHEPATALYAFCRVADDVIDNGGGAEALGSLYERLDLAYAGRPLPHVCDRAFAYVAECHASPRAVPAALLEGFAWDAQGRRYETIGDLYAYAARVAGTVGAMMTALMDARAPHVVARACDLGVAMQLTNIARDVGEDARNGRIYLPLEWLREAGIDPEAFLASPQFTPALGEVVQRLLDTADMLYKRADAGIARLPLSCRPGIGAARRLYAEIGREVERNGCDSISQRARVSSRRKAALLARSAAAAVWSVPDLTAPALPQTQFLVDAVAASRRPEAEPPVSRAVWLIDLFAKLEERDAMRATGREFGPAAT